MEVDELVALLRDGDRTAVVDGLAALTDAERRKLGPKARGWLTQGTANTIHRDRVGLAVLATSGGVRQALTTAVHLYSPEQAYVEDVVELFRRRPPAWLQAFVDGLVEDGAPWHWRTARALVVAGLAGPPEHPNYFTGVVRGAPDYFARRRPMLDQLESSPGLIGEDLLTMLATEGSGRLLAYHDRYEEESFEQHPHIPDKTPFPEGTWREALRALAEDGRLDRDRILDVTLAAPLRDWAAADLGWYVGFHDALAPTPAEVIARQATYARLLTAEHGPSVKLAQRELQRVIGEPGFDPGPLVAASRATLSRPDKASVTAQLRLLGRVAAKHPDAGVDGAVTVVLDHPRAEVREQARKLLGDRAPAPAAARSAFVPPEPEPWPDPDPVVPVADADELAEVLLGLLEEMEPVELERAVDGALRFADVTPSTAEVLMARAVGAEFYAGDPRLAVQLLVRAWLDPRRRFRGADYTVVLGQSFFPARVADPGSFVGAIGRRFSGVATAVRRGGGGAVALPTTADGSLAADVLSARLAGLDRGEQPLELELAIALLRVPPEDRADVRLPLRLRRVREVAHVLGTSPPDWEGLLHSTKPYHSWDKPEHVPLFRDRSGTGASGLDGVLARTRPELTVSAELTYGSYEPRFEQTLAVGGLMLPHHPDVLAAHAHPYLYRDLSSNRATGVAVIDQLARARRPLREPGASALVLAMAAKDARARTAAVDAIVDLARTGHLDGPVLGTLIAGHLAHQGVIGKRISTGLAEAARASDATLLPLLAALEVVLPFITERRDALGFVELAADLAERTGHQVMLPEVFAATAAGKSSSLLAKALRRLAAGG